MDSAGAVVTTKRLPRDEFLEWCAQLPAGCAIGMEACCAAHYWARKLTAIGLKPLLISPAFVTPYRMQGSTGKNDANDAAAICEATSRPHMRFVTVKTPEQQGLLALHTLREGMVRDRVACANRMRGVLAEFGLTVPKSVGKFEALVPELLRSQKDELTVLAKNALLKTYRSYEGLAAQIRWCDQQINKHAKTDPYARLAASVCGVGPMGASATAAMVGDLAQFKNGRQFSAWIGLVPRLRSSGETHRLGRITRRGNNYLRKLMVIGARAALRVAGKKDDPVSRWAIQLQERIGYRKAAVALANKNARIVWSLFAQQRSVSGVPSARRPTGSLTTGGLESETAVESDGERCHEPGKQLKEPVRINQGGVSVQRRQRKAERADGAPRTVEGTGSVAGPL